MAFFTAMPRPAASELADTSGAAARRSTAAAARECRRRPATAWRAARQARSRATSRSSPSAASSASALRNAGIQVSRCHGVSGRSARSPVSGTGARSRRWLTQNRTRAARIGGRAPPPPWLLPSPSPLAVAAEPGVQAGGGGEQRGGAGRGGCREDLCGALHVALLVEIRCHQPLVQVERVAGGGEDGAAVDDAERAVHAQAKTFEHGGEVPGIDRLSVDRGLAAHGVEPGAVQEGRQKRMAGERLVEPGDGGGGLRQGAGQRRIQVFFSRRRPQQCVEHLFPPPADRPASAGAALRRPAPPIRVESTACAPGYANRAIRCNSHVMCSDPPSRPSYAR